MNRRNFIKGSAVGAGSILVLDTVGCGGPSLSGTVTIITGAIAELKPLFPDKTSLLDKIAKLATDFNADWTAGKFDSARTIFDNLDSTINQVISDLEVNASTRVKLMLATLGIGIRTVAALISETGAKQPKAASMARSTASKTVDRVGSLANPSDADWILKAVRK